MAAVLAAARGEAGIVALGRSEEGRRRRTQRWCAVLADGAAQEYPRTFLAPLGQAGVAEDADVARDARLALPQHLGEFPHGQLHGAEQAHDAQPRRVRQGAQEGVDLHLGASYKEIFI